VGTPAEKTSASGTFPASVEYFTGGPMKRDLMGHIGTTILNMLNSSSHYGGAGTDCNWGNGTKSGRKFMGRILFIATTSPTRSPATNQAAQTICSTMRRRRL
jgi:hypothetical protein